MPDPNLPAIIPDDGLSSDNGFRQDESYAQAILDGGGLMAQGLMEAILTAGFAFRRTAGGSAHPVDPARLSQQTRDRIAAGIEHFGMDEAEPIAKPQGHFHKAWDRRVPVEQLRVGDHIRHPAITCERKIVSVKPHPKGGVQVKTLPCWIYKDQPGKILKAHLKGHAERWDGVTMIDASTPKGR